MVQGIHDQPPKELSHRYLKLDSSNLERPVHLCGHVKREPLLATVRLPRRYHHASVLQWFCVGVSPSLRFAVCNGGWS